MVVVLGFGSSASQCLPSSPTNHVNRVLVRAILKNSQKRKNRPYIRLTNAPGRIVATVRVVRHTPKCQFFGVSGSGNPKPSRRRGPDPTEGPDRMPTSSHGPGRPSPSFRQGWSGGPLNGGTPMPELQPPGRRRSKGLNRIRALSTVL